MNDSRGDAAKLPVADNEQSREFAVGGGGGAVRGVLCCSVLRVGGGVRWA